MSYGVTAKKKEDYMHKQYLADNRRPHMGRSQLNYQVYMDRLDNAINKNILDNIRPYWRDHDS